MTTNADRLALLAVVLAGPVVAVVADVLAGGHVHAGLVLLVIGSALATMWRPESHGELVTVLAVAVCWALAPTHQTSPWVLVAAAGLVASHVSTCVLAQVPPGGLLATPPPSGWLRLWAPRAALMWSAAAYAWLVVVAMHDRPHGGPVFTGAVVLIGVAAVVASVRVRPATE